MAWLPKWTVINGLFAGETPHGTLNGIPSYLGGNLIVASPYLSGGAGYYEDYFTHELEKAWEGAYGSNAQSMIDYAQQHGDTDDILLAEFNVRAAQGATYYKQTIAFYGSVTCQHIQDEHSDLDHIICEVNKICRRVYADPQSPPYISHTWFYRPFQGPNAYVYHSGDQSDMRLWFYDKMRCAFGYLTYNDEEYFGAFLYAEIDTFYDDNPLKGNQGHILAVKCGDLSEAFDIDFTENPLPDEKDDPNEEEPPEDEPGEGGGGGGEGSHVLPDEDVPFPDIPEVGAAGVNWLTVYKMTEFQINEFGQELIDPDVWTIVKSWFTNPLDAIIGIILIPCDAPTTRTKHPEVGGGITGHTWPNAYPVLSKEFVDIDCGTIKIDPYWDSAFDFDPYTKFSLFLPFIGFKPIKSDDIMGANVQVKYRVNVMTGDCIAAVIRSGTTDNFYGAKHTQVIGEYNGNCGVRVPIGRVSHDAAIDASMRLMATGLGMIGGAIAGQAMGDPMNIGASQVSNQISSATMTTVNGMKQGVERSGALGGSAGYMGNLRPFIIRSIPKQFLPDNYKRLNGYPANKGGTLSHYTGTGFQAVETIQLDGLRAYDNEIDEIRSLLKGGVLV